MATRKPPDPIPDPTPHYRAVWISDVHLGTRACKAELLKDFLKSFEADTIYLVGDIIDGWELSSSWYWPPEHSEIIRLLLKKSREGKVVYVPGNHDEAVRDFCPLLFGNIDILTHAEHRTLNGQRMLIIHGDIFDSFVSNLKHVAALGSFAYDTIIRLNNASHWVLNKLGLPYWSLAEFVKSRTREAMKAIERYEEAAASYAKRKGFDAIVAGHIHSPCARTIDGVQYFNDGDWVDSCSALVETQEGELKLLDWKGH